MEGTEFWDTSVFLQSRGFLVPAPALREAFLGVISEPAEATRLWRGTIIRTQTISAWRSKLYLLAAEEYKTKHTYYDIRSIIRVLGDVGIIRIMKSVSCGSQGLS
jgi:hypothetical protein